MGNPIYSKDDLDMIMLTAAGTKVGLHVSSREQKQPMEFIKEMDTCIRKNAQNVINQSVAVYFDVFGESVRRQAGVSYGTK